MFKFKHTYSKIFFVVLGAVYLTTFSNLDINIFLKSYAAIVPVQMLALVYGVYLICIKKQKNSRKFKSNNQS